MNRIQTCLARASEALADNHPASAKLHIEEALGAIAELPLSERNPWLQAYELVNCQLPKPAFTCEGCGGKCCRNVLVVLQPEEERWFLENHPDNLETRPFEGKAWMVLKNVHAEDDYGVRCPFLDQTTGWCKIHEYRPSVCRLFPVGCHRCRELRGA